MQTITVANHKGGVGKTATAHALGSALAEGGRSVLMLDLDPQGSLTGACGVSSAEGASLAEVLGGATPGTMPLSKIILELEPNLYLAPADIALAATELALTSRMGRENALKRVLAPVESRFDVALIDCPPSLGILTLNGLVAGQGVLIPTQPQVVDLRGLRLFLDTLVRIREELNPTLETVGVLVTFYDRRFKHHQDAVRVMKDAELPLLPVMIGRSVRVAEASASGQPVTTYDPKNPQAEHYRELAEVIDRWLNERR